MGSREGERRGADSSGGGEGGGNEGEKGQRSGRGGGNVRGFRTANYVNCRCCKLPSQFAFILHTIHTVSAHLARNPSTWILLLPPTRRRIGEGRKGGGGEGEEKTRERTSGEEMRREGRWRRIERDG